MKRALIRRFAEPADAVELQEVPLPEPGPGEVLVRLAARPINPTDVLLATGRHIVRPELPSPIGIEGAGVVVALGEGTQGLTIGQSVAIPFGGTWCDAMVARVGDLVPLPAGADLLQASMLCVNPMTAALLLEGLEPGAWFVHDAAGSAIGRLITAMGARRGLHSVAVVRREDHAPALLELGARAVVVDGPELPERVRAATGGAPIQRAMDAVAGDTAHRLLRCLADGGELVSYGLLASDEVRLPATELIFRDLRVRGLSRLRSMRSLSTDRLGTLLAELSRALIAGELDVPVEATYPLAQLGEALAHVQRADRRGKILLVDPCRPPPEPNDRRHPSKWRFDN